jgi:hypothetical protein
MTPGQKDFAEKCATALLAFGQGFPRGTFSDAYTWSDEGRGDYSRLNFAFVGDALKVALLFDVGMTYERTGGSRFEP